MVKMFLLVCSDRELHTNYCHNDNLLDEYYKAGNWDIYSCFERGNGYFENKRLYNEAVDKTRNYIIWTNDETMLDYMQEDLFNGREYGVDLFIQDVNKEKLTFVDVLKECENIRKPNYVKKIILSGRLGCIPNE